MLRSRGSAPVDFVLIISPLLLLSFGIVSIAIDGYAINIAQDVAIRSAHLAALADSDLTYASQSADQELRASLSGLFDASVEIGKLFDGTGCRTTANVTLHTLTLGLLLSGTQLKETASAICEIQE